MKNKLSEGEKDLNDILAAHNCTVEYEHVYQRAKVYQVNPNRHPDRTWEDRDIQGFTVARIHTKDPEHALISVGIAYCSASDSFNRKKGRIIALSRALRRQGWIPGRKPYDPSSS